MHTKIHHTGAGNVTGVPKNHDTIARFTDELETGTTLKCTVKYGDIQTDTAWTIDNYKGNTIVHKKDIASFGGFKIYGEEHKRNKDLCDNLMDIRGDVLKDLNGTTVHCGSYMNRYQAKFEFHTCGKSFQSRTEH